MDGPPKATLSRRAQSYSDFHDAVKAVLGQDVASKGTTKEEPYDENKIGEKDLTSDLDFVEWYNGLEQELLDSSHDNYTSVNFGNILRSGY